MEYISAEFRPLSQTTIDSAVANCRSLANQRQETADQIRQARTKAVRNLRRRHEKLTLQIESELTLASTELERTKNRELDAYKIQVVKNARENCISACISAVNSVLEHFPREIDRALTRVVSTLLDSLGNDIITEIEIGALSIPPSTLKAFCQTRNIAIVENHRKKPGDLSISLNSGTAHSSLQQDVRCAVEQQPFLLLEEKSA